MLANVCLRFFIKRLNLITHHPTSQTLLKESITKKEVELKIKKEKSSFEKEKKENIKRSQKIKIFRPLRGMEINA